MIKIFYFSATGNSLWSAKEIAALLKDDCQIYSIADFMRKPEYHDIEADAVALVFPAYAYQTPKIVRAFLRTARVRAPYIAAFVTYGSSPGGALAECSRLLNRQGAFLSFAGKIPTVENYMPIFGCPGEKTISRRLSLQNAATKEAAQIITERRENFVWPFRPLSWFISTLFRAAVPLFVPHYKVSSRCTGCGVCAQVCPVGACILENGRPLFRPHCEHCMACFAWCPTAALTYLRINSRSSRWRHPGITARDIKVTPFPAPSPPNFAACGIRGSPNG